MGSFICHSGRILTGSEYQKMRRAHFSEPLSDHEKGALSSCDLTIVHHQNYVKKLFLYLQALDVKH